MFQTVLLLCSFGKKSDWDDIRILKKILQHVYFNTQTESLEHNPNSKITENHMTGCFDLEFRSPGILNMYMSLIACNSYCSSIFTSVPVKIPRNDFRNYHVDNLNTSWTDKCVRPYRALRSDQKPWSIIYFRHEDQVDRSGNACLLTHTTVWGGTKKNS